MNINQLRYFIGVAEYQSFTKAASRYYITQTAITQQIRALESHLGVQLFDRNTRPVRLTPEGSVFLREAKGILERVEQAEHRVREASVGLVGSLKVGYIKGYERSSLSDRLRSFHNKYPTEIYSPGRIRRICGYLRSVEEKQEKPDPGTFSGRNQLKRTLYRLISSFILCYYCYHKQIQ